MGPLGWAAAAHSIECRLLALVQAPPGRYIQSMTRSVTVARIRDIDVRLHPTFVLVFLWVLIDWRRLGAGHGALAVVFTLVLVLLVFGCVLLHEFGHAFMARHYGVRVHDVSLSAIGGMARMEQLPGDPRSSMKPSGP